MDQLRSILHDVGTSVFYGMIVIAIGFVVFTVMERMFSLRPGKKTWRATFLDLQYALLSMLYPPFINFLIAAFFADQALHFNLAPHNPQLSPLYFAGQVLAVLFARDCLIYVRHRIFHLPKVWAFHSIHHSSEEVNWLSALRFHPTENIIEGTAEIILFLVAAILGMDPVALSVASLIIAFHNLFIHSNLRWTFGPVRYVLVSPVLHRWHHSDLPEARDKNFAAMFSCLDLLLGTFYMPKGVMPETVGLSPEEKTAHPRTLAGQLWYPFRRR
jgi:sterol desaturase/sphingolipid hydroxylase (fatty acid hydroxylase superfamily)